MSDTDDDDLFVPTNKPTSKLLVLGGDDDDADPMGTMGVKQQTDVEIKIRPWMKYHDSILIETVGELEKLVDLCIANGRASLDLETTGLDNRVYFHDPATLDSTHERWWDESNPPAKVPVTVHKVVGYCISPDGRTGYYAPIRHTAKKSNNLDPVGAGRAIQRLCQAAQPEINPEGLVEDPLGSTNIKTLGKVKLLFWYAKFDQEFLYPITGIDWWHPESFEDGMLMYFTKLSNDKSLGLKDKSKRKLVVKDKNGVSVYENGSEVPYEMVELKECFAPGRSISFPELDPREALPYTSGDSICTFLHCTKPDVCDVITDKKFAQTYRLEKQVTQVTRIMERNRIRIDRKYVTDLLAEAEKEALVYRDEIIALAVQLGFNNFDPQSPKQLSEFLFASPNGLRIEPKPEQNEKSGQYKTDADTFEKLVEENPNINPILITVVKYRQVEKVVGTYLKSMHNNTDKYGDLRYQFRQVGAATGRFSAPAGDPEHGYGGVPVHGIPSTYDDKKPKVATALRKAFIARPGYAILKVDYAGEELRIVTNLSKEPVWEKEFCEGTGDLHSITARAFFAKAEVSKQERQQGKMANFSLVYGGGVNAIMRSTGCNQIEAARRKSNFDKSMPVFAGWVAKQKKKVHMEKGVFTAFGRWIAIPEIDNENKAIQAGGERCSTNYPIQGSAADLMKVAMIRLHKIFYLRSWFQNDTVRMMLTVHDELVFEIKFEAIMEVVPVIEAAMAMKDLTDKLKWKVPLIVEPLIDLTWDAKYDFSKMVHGEHKPEKPGDKPLKSGEVRVGDRVYQRVPDIFAGYIIPDWDSGSVPPVPSSTPPSDSVPPSTPVASIAVQSVERVPTVSVVSQPVERAPVAAPAATPAAKSNQPFFQTWISVLSPQSITQVWEAVHHAWPDDSDTGKLLKLLDTLSGSVLIDPEETPICVKEGKFNDRIRSLNL